MGLPRPLGPFPVAFADFELRRTEGTHGGIVAASASSTPQHHSPDFVRLADAQGAPLVRIFYPTSDTSHSSWNFSGSNRWMPSIMYTWGYLSKLIPPSSFMSRFAIWIFAGIIHSCMWPGAVIQASVGGPILPVQDDREEGRLPVVIFSHGLWACRTTYSALCCDIASHGYIVVAPEHLDGSANMASYADQNGKRKWLQNSFASIPVDQITIRDRTKQLRQRVLEVRKVLDVLESLDRGLLTQNANTINGKAALDVSMLQARLDLHFVAVAGHSFGGATAVVAAGVDKRLKCCVGMDVWWEPIEKKKGESFIWGCKRKHSFCKAERGLKRNLQLYEKELLAVTHALTTWKHNPIVARRFRNGKHEMSFQSLIRVSLNMEYERLAGKIPVLLLNTENFDWKALHDARIMFIKARAEASEDGRGLITELKTIKGTSHQDQSDVTMLFPRIMKRTGVAGQLDPVLTKNINSRACLNFLHKHMLPPGTGSPYAVDVERDAEHLIISNVT